ncbi:hypothetical protein MRX96_010416 [Rhipicephalus microplus]
MQPLILIGVLINGSAGRYRGGSQPQLAYHVVALYRPRPCIVLATCQQGGTAVVSKVGPANKPLIAECHSCSAAAKVPTSVGATTSFGARRKHSALTATFPFGAVRDAYRLTAPRLHVLQRGRGRPAASKLH